MASTDVYFGTNYDKRFYGIYRGLVMDADDPEKRNRLRLKVPQVTGEAITNWASACEIGSGLQKRVFGSFYSTDETSIAQTGSSAFTTIPITTTEYASGVSVKNNKISVAIKGVYRITSVIAVVCTSGSSDTDIEFWWMKNSVPIPGTRRVVTTKGAGHNVTDVHVEAIELTPTDTLEAAAAATGANIRLEAFTTDTNPTRPTGYSVNVFVDTYQYTPAEGVWVMYEGGDPNFPVWIGTF